MKRNIFKAMGMATLFGIFFLGVSVSKQKIKMANEQQSVTLFSLGIQAKAYCNEAAQGEGSDDGHCTGQHNDPNTRCEVPAIGVTKNCKRDF